MAVIKILGIVSVLVAIIAFLPEVDSLPFGLDEALIFFVALIKGVIAVFPPLQVVFDVLLYAFFIEVLLFLWHWIRYVINLFSHS